MKSERSLTLRHWMFGMHLQFLRPYAQLRSLQHVSCKVCGQESPLPMLNASSVWRLEFYNSQRPFVNCPQSPKDTYRKSHWKASFLRPTFEACFKPAGKGMDPENCSTIAHLQDNQSARQKQDRLRKAAVGCCVMMTHHLRP